MKVKALSNIIFNGNIFYAGTTFDIDNSISPNPKILEIINSNPIKNPPPNDNPGLPPLHPNKK